MIVKKYVTDIFNKKYYAEEKIRIEENLKEENNIINVHPEKTYQDWLGLGGALTNSTTYNYNKLSDEKKDALLNDFASPQYGFPPQLYQFLLVFEILKHLWPQPRT